MPSETAPRPDDAFPELAAFSVLGVRVSAIDMRKALDFVDASIRGGRRAYVCVSNVHSIMECQRDPELLRVHNAAGMVTPDGMPLVWLGHAAGHRDVRRVYGPDLLLAACERSVARGYRHFFYGGGEGVAERLAARLCERFPGLRVAGSYCPPFGPLSAEEDAALLERIAASGADIVWVGLGMPKQERFMAEHLGRVSAPLMIGVGAAFDFHAGLKPQAPLWMQHSGLEWLFRLASEPRRLWRRYLINNPLFVLHVLLERAGLRRHGEAAGRCAGDAGPEAGGGAGPGDSGV